MILEIIILIKLKFPILNLKFSFVKALILSPKRKNVARDQTLKIVEACILKNIVYNYTGASKQFKSHAGCLCEGRMCLCIFYCQPYKTGIQSRRETVSYSRVDINVTIKYLKT